MAGPVVAGDGGPDALASDGGYWAQQPGGACLLDAVVFGEGGEAQLYYGDGQDPDGIAAYSFSDRVLSAASIGAATEGAAYIPKFLGGMLKDDGTLFVTEVYVTKDDPDREVREVCLFFKAPPT